MKNKITEGYMPFMRYQIYYRKMTSNNPRNGSGCALFYTI